LADIGGTLLLDHEPLPDFGFLPERNGVGSPAGAERHKVGRRHTCSNMLSLKRIAAEPIDRTVGPAAGLCIDHAGRSPTKFELVINLMTGKAPGLTVPLAPLTREPV
jgi:hypothetical protein